MYLDVCKHIKLVVMYILQHIFNTKRDKIFNSFFFAIIVLNLREFQYNLFFVRSHVF